MSANEYQPSSEKERRSPLPPPGQRGGAGKRASTTRRVPWLKLLLFYGLLIGVATLLTQLVPLFRDAWVSAPMLERVDDFSRDALSRAVAVQDPMHTRALSVLLITLGALALSLPIAWVYTFTRRLTYDASLVHSVIILPMVVSGIVVVVRDSIALAFSLAGIVAAVRFRNTLKDPKDAVYIFLAIGIGLASGVQASDVALVMSMVFNTVVLVLWKYNFGAIYGETHRDILAVGDSQLMIARGAAQAERIRARIGREVRDMDIDGVLIVHAPDVEAAKQRVQLTLAHVAEDWRIAENVRQRDGIGTFFVMLRFKEDEEDPLELLADIDERWSREVAAAEYVPFKKTAEKEKGDEEQ
jgi:hypothetical protein